MLVRPPLISVCSSPTPKNTVSNSVNGTPKRTDAPAVTSWYSSPWLLSGVVVR